MGLGCVHTPCIGLREPCEQYFPPCSLLTSRFVVAEFSGGADSLEIFHIAEVTEDGVVIVVASHSANHSNLYISDIVSPY